jgi:hypothetical protein
MRRASARFLSITLGTVGMLAVLVSPASANDMRFEFRSPELGNLLAVGTYDDLTDKYCVRHVSGHTNAVLTSTRPNGADLRRVEDAPGGGATCTGNLSIPEDQYRLVRIRAAEWRSGARYHYT